MNRRPRISICVPTYNGRAHLKECLDSIRAQSFQDFEVLVCDDQSSDGTLALARELAKGDERFRFVQNPVRFGLVCNWNNCVALSRGEWIKFVFQDDFLMPECLERMVGAADKSGSRFLACRRDFCFGKKAEPEIRAFYAANAKAVDLFFFKEKTRRPDEIAKEVLRSLGVNFVGEPTATLIHREVFAECGNFNENLIMSCDSEYWYRVATHTALTFVPDTLAVFRVHETSTSAENFGRRQFRMGLLDPFIIVHEFIHNPAYRRLREVAENCFGSKFLEQTLRTRARNAWGALKEKQDAKDPDAPVCLKEWESVCKQYPDIQELSRFNLGDKLREGRNVRAFGRAVGKALSSLRAN